MVSELFTERDAIKLRMEQIVQERQALQSEYKQLLERLRELDFHVVEQENRKVASEIEAFKDSQFHKRAKRTNVKGVVMPAIVNILRESGKPLKPKEISQKLTEKGVRHNAIHPILIRLRQERSDVVQVKWGYWGVR
ncbi:MAG: hypothetical protein M0Z65_03525 [Firmicutes bacterium]|nr:hypothetical protein [Bacillota bacterium]